MGTLLWGKLTHRGLATCGDCLIDGTYGYTELYALLVGTAFNTPRNLHFLDNCTDSAAGGGGEKGLARHHKDICANERRERHLGIPVEICAWLNDEPPMF